MTKDEEMTVIDRVLSGDYNAFEELVLDNQDKVYSLALRLVGNPEDAFDMSQEAFLRAYNNLSNFRGDSKFSSWLYRLTSNICIDFMRKRGRRPASSLTVLDNEGEEREYEIPDTRFEPQSELLQRELRDSLERGLDSLPENYREVLVLREISGLSYDEIARTLDLESGTVKSRIFRARKKLCAFLQSEGNLSALSASKRHKEV